MLIASKISHEKKLEIPSTGTRCYVVINDEQKIEMRYRKLKGKAKGLVWFFVCPVTGKPCLRLYPKNGLYVHRTEIKNFARLNKPAWHTNTKFNKVLIIKQRQIDAEKMMNKKYFKKHYRGKPTKQYLKCLRHIEAASDITISGIINGMYENFNLP